MFESEISQLKSLNLYRRLRVGATPQGVHVRANDQELINFSSNDYLGLAFHPEVIRGAQAAAERWGTGAGASRLVSGSMEIHEELERRLARWLGTEAALVFSSGFQANLGVIQTLVGAGDEVYIDRFVHASLVDGARASGAKLRVYPHGDTERLETLLAKSFSGKRLIVTDSYFSMDGDRAPLKKLIDFSKKFQTMLMVDEAHALGVYGLNGGGLLREENSTEKNPKRTQQPDQPNRTDRDSFFLFGKKIDSVTAVTGTLSKSLGVQGGFIACSASLKELLINKARSFIYSTGISPMVCGAALAALDVMEKSDELRLRLWENVRRAREGLQNLDLDLGNSEGPIIPMIFGQTQRTLEVADHLREAGILAVAIRPPTVPPDTDRIRLTITVKHTTEDIDHLIAALRSHSSHS